MVVTKLSAKKFWGRGTEDKKKNSKPRVAPLRRDLLIESEDHQQLYEKKTTEFQATVVVQAKRSNGSMRAKEASC
jgi:hypothetical protein